MCGLFSGFQSDRIHATGVTASEHSNICRRSCYMLLSVISTISDAAFMQMLPFYAIRVNVDWEIFRFRDVVCDMKLKKQKKRRNKTSTDDF